MDQIVKISSKCFRNMILFSGKYGNRLMPPEDLKHAYGWVLGRMSQQDAIEVMDFIPIGEGTITEQHIDVSSMPTDLRNYEENVRICGYFHSSPRSRGMLTDSDRKSISTFDPGTLCVIFDFAKVDQFNNGFLVFQTDGSHITNTPYIIFHPDAEDKFYFARSLVGLSAQYESSGTIDEFNTPSSRFDDSVDLSAPDNIAPREFTHKEFEVNFLEDATQSEYEEFELSLIDQDFEVQKLRNDIDQASKEGKSSAHLKLLLANRLLAHLANASEVQRYLESAEEEYSANTDTESRAGLAIVKNELGLFYEDRGNLYTALNYFDDSFSILEEIGDTIKIVRVLNNIANIYFKLNNFESALKKYHEAYDKASNLADKVLVFNNIADVYLKLQNYERAYSILIKNAEFFQETQNNFGLSLVFTKLGKLYYEQGAHYYHLAKKYIHLALAIKKRNEFHRECIEDYQLLSTIYIIDESYRVAEDNLVQGLNLVRSLGFEQEEAFFYENLGKLYLIEGRFEESIEYYEIAKDAYDKFGDNECIGITLEIIGDIYSQSLGKLSNALQYYEKALILFKEEKLSRKQADILVKIAEIHIEHNETTSAIESLHKAHSLYKTMYDDTTAKIISERINSLEY